MLGYDDALMTVDKVMVRIDATGKFAALPLEEYYEAKRQGGSRRATMALKTWRLRRMQRSNALKKMHACRLCAKVL